MAYMNIMKNPAIQIKNSNNSDSMANNASHAKNTSFNITKTNPYQQYQQNSVNTASPQELTLMLYNGLVKFLKMSAQGIEDKEIEKAHNYIIRSQDIIVEFMSTLDMQYDVSKNLMALYDYMNKRLIEANMKKDKSILEEIIGLAEDLRDTWVQAMKIVKNK